MGLGAPLPRPREVEESRAFTNLRPPARAAMPVVMSTATTPKVPKNYRENGRLYHGFRKGQYVLPCDEVRANAGSQREEASGRWLTRPSHDPA